MMVKGLFYTRSLTQKEILEEQSHRLVIPQNRSEHDSFHILK